MTTALMTIDPLPAARRLIAPMSIDLEPICNPPLRDALAFEFSMLRYRMRPALLWLAVNTVLAADWYLFCHALGWI